ncbi:MAG: GAP family protein [Rhizobiaceae bacterium]|nr:GAP family protein [Rhizobiaceae bacterium]
MLAQAIGEMLPVMAAIALTPLQIIGMVLVLGGPNARAAGPALLAGWLAALAAVTAIAIFLVERASESGRTGSPFIPWLQVALGLLLFWAALRLWKTRPRGDEQPPTPKWLVSFGDANPARALMLGAMLCVANPKIVALVLAGMTSLAYLSLTSGQIVAVAAIFVLLSSLPVIALAIAHAAGGEGMAAHLQNLKTFMLRNNNLILMVVFAILGVSVFGKGLAGLGE